MYVPYSKAVVTSTSRAAGLRPCSTALLLPQLMEAAASLTGGYLYSLRIKRGSCVKGSTSAAFTVQVDARIETVLDLKCTLLEQHPELSAGGEPQLQILGQGGRGGRATLPDAAHLTTLRLEQQCTASTPGGKPAASLMVNQGELVPEEEMSFAAADADTVTAALAGDGEGSAVGGGLLTGSLLERLAAASIAAAPASATATGAVDAADVEDELDFELDFSEAEFVAEDRPDTNSPAASGALGF